MNVIVQICTIQFVFKISLTNIFLHLYLHFECTLCLFIHCATSQIRSISISYIQNKSKIILNPAASLCMVLTLWLLSNKIIPSYRSFAHVFFCSVLLHSLQALGSFTKNYLTFRRVVKTVVLKVISFPIKDFGLKLIFITDQICNTFCLFLFW